MNDAVSGSRIPGARALRKEACRLIPFLWLMYVAAFLDRAGVGFAALQMKRDLGFSPYVYGLGAGIFFIGYCLFEVPSNPLLHRVGGPRWLARITVSWAFIAGALACTRGPISFCVLRFLLGVAEAGFFPGVIYYLTLWVPADRRGQVLGTFMTAIPVSTALGGPLATRLLSLDGLWGLSGWQWLYVVETLPSLALGLATLTWLPAAPAQAGWLTTAEKRQLTEAVEATSAQSAPAPLPMLRALVLPEVLGLCLCYFGVEVGLYGIIFWIPQILAHAGIRPGLLGWAVAIPYLCAAAGMVWWSRHSDRQAEREWHLLAASLTGGVGLALSALLDASAIASLAAITLGAMGTLAVLPIFWKRPAALPGGATAAGAIALINAIGNIGGFVRPFVIGALKQSSGSFTAGLLVAAAGVLMSGILTMLFARRPMPGEALEKNA